MKNKLITILFYLLFFLILSQCSVRRYVVEEEKLSIVDSYYSNVPIRDISKYLKKAESYVKFISSICYYKGYVLSERLKISEREARLIDLQKFAEREIFFNRTSSGTAVVLYSDIEKALLLTCAHVINFPDTILSYYYIESGKKNVVESVGFRIKQEFFTSAISRITTLSK